MKKPSLCVVICVHNAPEYVEICIESVLRHTYGHYELILVNDGSKTEAREIVKRFARTYPYIRAIHHASAQGYTKAANVGLHASYADYTILLNSDTIVSPGWAEKIVQCGESDAAIGIIGPLSNAATYQSVPLVFEEDGTWKHNVLPGEITVGSYAEAIAKVALRSYPRMPVANGFCFAIKRAVIDAIGYLDEETFPQGYGEENDYCLRAADAGFEIAVADDTYIYHAVSRSFGVKAREQLTRTAHHAIRAKHSQERLDGIDSALRNHHGMDRVRERIMEFVERAPASPLYAPRQQRFAKPNQSMPILFLLPDCAASAGGTQMVIELARGLNAMQVPLTIAVKKALRPDYETYFPADNHLMFYYGTDQELVARSAQAKIVIATIFHSVRLLRLITDTHRHIVPLYFVQDYEPLFLDPYPHLKDQALESYMMVKNCQLVAISPWVQEILLERHGIDSHKFRGSIDPFLFYPDHDRPAAATLKITAMIRPHTPWRAPERTLRIMRALQSTFGDAIELHIFGCSDEDLELTNIPDNLNVTNHGVLNRHDVAGLLRMSDIFLDLSDFQAFGRTALEAMACGCSVVAPVKGGVKDFGRDGENILMVDTADDAMCIQAVSLLVTTPDLRASLRSHAIHTGLEYGIQRSAMSFLELTHRLAENSKASEQAAA